MIGSQPSASWLILTVQGIAWFPEKDAALLEALQRWAIALPHMLLFHVCQGYDKDEVLKVCRQSTASFQHATSALPGWTATVSAQCWPWCLPQKAII